MPNPENQVPGHVGAKGLFDQKELVEKSLVSPAVFPKKWISRGGPLLSRIAETVFPARCPACLSEGTENRHLCPDCWAECHFSSGLCCYLCGVPVSAHLPFERADSLLVCESCNSYPPPWSTGVCVAHYTGPVRKMILGLKHGDRQDAGVALGDWLAHSTAQCVNKNAIVVPVPLHRFRFLRRKFNQSALLGRRVAKLLKLEWVPDGLIRKKQTRMQKGMKRQERFENQRGAIGVHPARKDMLIGRHVLIIDDVMTTGATLSACTVACLAAGAETVMIGVVARVAPFE